MHDAVLHLGHCYRTSGFTGTAGHRGTEQEFVSNVGEAMADRLRLQGVDAVTALADASLPRCRLFVALHQDGSVNPRARGASVGYPSAHGPSRQAAQIWKAHYATTAGWPSGFRGDNYTRALRTYYGFRRVHADAKYLIEHGFATNRADADYMWDNVGRIVKANCDAIVQWLGPPVEPYEEGLVDMETLVDTTTGEHWVCANGKARPLSNPDAWMASWVGPTRKSANMTHVISDLYTVVG